MGLASRGDDPLIGIDDADVAAGGDHTGLLIRLLLIGFNRHQAGVQPQGLGRNGSRSIARFSADDLFNADDFSRRNALLSPAWSADADQKSKACCATSEGAAPEWASAAICGQAHSCNA